jgi:hypothetical protein
MKNPKIEIYSMDSKTDEHFINRLNDSLNIIREETNNKDHSISIDDINELYSNSPIMSVSNSDEENDCFEDINEFIPKETFQKLTYQNVKNSLDKYYETEDKYSDELDLLIAYLNGQKHMYIQAKELTQLKLNLLLFPSMMCSTSLTFFSPFIINYSWSGIFIAIINAVITACLSIIHYLKLESSVDFYIQLIDRYEKLENSLQLTISKLFFLEDKRENNNIIMQKIEEFELKMNEIKDITIISIPSELKNVFPIIYHIHIFSFIKRIEIYKRNQIMKFKEIKNEIRYIVWKYGNKMNNRVKNRLEFISNIKIKLKDELLYYKNAYGIMEELFLREIKQSETIGISKYWMNKKKPQLLNFNPVIDQYLSSIFIDS